MIKRMTGAILLGMIGCALLVALGVWQVQRLAWKEALLAEIDARIEDAPVALPDDPREERHQYMPVELSATILEGEITILASLRNAGPVYRIIRAVETAAGRRILVDMGFVQETEHLADRPYGARVELVGNLYWPDETDAFTPEPDRAAGIWFARDIPAMAAELDTEPVLVVLREAPRGGLGVTPFPVGTGAIPNDHLSYAITWFLMAVAWLGMTLTLLWRIKQRIN
ncbi:MAG: SURF1 family protein [Rhodobacteraceae bacterium CG17_big_fil_post_rev_8_21_14_2_50_65_11]|nr:MAG: SURF1 family protein [Rhodobacteraceae bacterium CG17_big_fil_post_rev_8_21_14_2_50_65_11]